MSSFREAEDLLFLALTRQQILRMTFPDSSPAK
jgi:hypothetical protein